MLFSSLVFLFYFLPISLIVYYSLWFSNPLKNAALLILSLVFYAWGEPKYIIILFISVIVNYLLGIYIDKYRSNEKVAKFIIIIACIVNLATLFIFKYLGFVIRNINELHTYKIESTHITLPIGISFFTFRAISYVIDVYKNVGLIQKNPINAGLYTTFFPQILAGPVTRYIDMANQIESRKETWRKFAIGCCRFITGLSKKVLIANTMAVIVDRIFKMSSNGSISVSLAWLGSIAYTLQIFFDFSGYSDMALGIGLMFGFKFDENFNYPYISKSISEFWRRWHISLSTWFKEYVYFPLGGSRVANKDIMIRNLLIVWILTGAWHGAEWTFVIWGIFNFVLVALEKLISFDEIKGFNKLKHLYAIFFINLGWVLFRSGNLIAAGKYFACMFGVNSSGFWSDYTYMFIKENLVFFIAAIVLSTRIGQHANKFILRKSKFYKFLEIMYPLGIILLFIISISYIIKGANNPFIYFNF
jgi:alginate O-acetyltransferase complex protein AlgI